MSDNHASALPVSNAFTGEASRDDALSAVDKIADQLGAAIAGDFDFFVRAETDNETIQKLAVMINFLLESFRETINLRDSMSETLRGQAFLRQLIDVSPSLIYAKDIDGHFVLANRAVAEVYGTTTDALIGKHDEDFSVRCDTEAQAANRRVISTGISEISKEESITKPDGQVLWFQTSRVAVRDDQAGALLVLCVASDITVYKRNSEELSRLVSELQSAIKFKDQFLATMSHELRTPLNAILGFSGIQLMSERLPRTTKTMLERIDFNARRLANLINDILDISRINAGRIEILWTAVDIRLIAQTWFSDFEQRMLSKGLHLRLHIDAAMPTFIHTDPERLTQIANNLLTNALKFTQKGSISIAITRNGDHWSLVVTDTGIGIPEAWHQTIFEEFRQVENGFKGKNGGIGLGLSIVQRLCILMNGQIRVNSVFGRGSKFTATFPIQQLTATTGAIHADT